MRTLAGSGAVGRADGEGAGATFSAPSGVAVSANTSGVVAVADTGNGCVRLVTPTGFVTTLACGFPGMSGIARSSSGLIYVTDPNSWVVKAIAPDGAVAQTLPGANFQHCGDPWCGNNYHGCVTAIPPRAHSPDPNL